MEDEDNGYINIINPFRGTIVLGTPGSGKSFGIIDPFIRQHARKGFAMMVYDYKFPTLAKTLFYQYCKNLHYGNLPNGCGFRIVNFTDVEYSNRINPIQRKYIPDLAHNRTTERIDNVDVAVVHTLFPVEYHRDIH